MKVSRRVQRQVEIIIRHAQASELAHPEVPSTASSPLKAKQNSPSYFNDGQAESHS
jgi:hypothetical protein